MSKRRFVIGDIHGCGRTLRALLDDVIRLQPVDQLYLLGDYIDRGPRSAETLDTIMGLIEKGFKVNALRGNHEEMLLDSKNSAFDRDLWLMNGGHATLDSFGADCPDMIPPRYLRFLEKLRYYIILDDFILVHACLNFDTQDPFADRKAMLWSRNCTVDEARTGNRRLICGHTPVHREIVEESLRSSRILLDNGCVFRGFPGLGALAALELDSMTLYFQENID